MINIILRTYESVLNQYFEYLRLGNYEAAAIAYKDARELLLKSSKKTSYIPKNSLESKLIIKK